MYSILGEYKKQNCFILQLVWVNSPKLPHRKKRRPTSNELTQVAKKKKRLRIYIYRR